MQLEHVINGKAVRLKARIPFREGRTLPGLLNQCKDEDLGTFIPLFTKVIESWGFDGDPADEVAYAELDTFTEAMPLMAIVGAYVNERAAEAANTKA